MADVLTYAVSAAPPVDSDVVTRELSVAVNGVKRAVTTHAGSSVDLGSVDVPQDAEVVLLLVDVDDAGNRSEAAELKFVAVDTIAPAAPGALGVSLVGERRVKESVTEPEITPAEEAPVVSNEVVDTDENLTDE